MFVVGTSEEGIMVAVDRDEKNKSIPHYSQDLWSNTEIFLHLDSADWILLPRAEIWHYPGS